MTDVRYSVVAASPSTGSGLVPVSDGVGGWNWGANAVTPGIQTLTDAATVTIDANFNGGTLSTVSQGITFAAPVNSPGRLRYSLEIMSLASQTIAWNAAFEGSSLNPLPTLTSGGSVMDLVLLIWSVTKSKFVCAGYAPGYA